MADPLVRVHVHQAAGTLILNRPDKRNALSRAMIAELAQGLEDLRLERSVRAIVITGAGSAFCAGMDLAEMLDSSQHDDAYERWAEDAQIYHDLLVQMLHYPKTIIAAVNGPALAGGAGLVLGSDVVIASDEARFGLPEPLRGLVAGIVAPLLAFRAGGGHAAYLLTTAQSIDSAEAHRVGLFHEITAADKLWPRASELAEECAGCAPEAIQLTKRMLNETIGEHLGTLLSAGAAMSATARTTEAAREGLRAFLEKRPPRWR
ncbi:MAG: enoyl-CoA hydratase/isomerase family protein [Pirellulales bacterium]|nr:enoyl-CoA hydratase/isomerase family protein [Planctomycetales bacterium]